MFLLSAGGLSVVLLALTLASWYVYKSFSTPSDIMLAICLSEFVENISLFVQAGNQNANYLVYFTSYDSSQNVPPDF